MEDGLPLLKRRMYLLGLHAAVALTLVVVSAHVLVVFAACTLGTLSCLSGRHIGTCLSETTNGSVGVELNLLAETVLLLLATLELKPLVTPSATTAVVFLAELVAHLATTPASPKLAALLVARVQVAADDTLV
jgi:hypothetical protein